MDRPPINERDVMADLPAESADRERRELRAIVEAALSAAERASGKRTVTTATLAATIEEMGAEAERLRGELADATTRANGLALLADGRYQRITRALAMLDGLRPGHCRTCAVYAGDPCDCGHVARWEAVRDVLRGRP
jgi:acyl-CoA reductase-like NAD-dependent aldehyde dehydrogenase